MTCTPSLCVGGTCASSSSTCTCPAGWERQWSFVKESCSSPVYLREVANALLIVTSGLVLVRCAQILPRARNASLSTVKWTMVCQLGVLGCWCSTLAEHGLYAAALGFLAVY